MNEFVKNALTNWKSTTQSVLTVAIAVGVYLTVTPGAVSPKVAGIATTVVGVAKVILGCLEKD